MATYDDWSRILSNQESNPSGLSLANVLDAVSSQAPPLTLLEQKQQKLFSKLQNKSSNLGIGIPQSSLLPSQNINFFDSGIGSTGLADLGEASLYRAGGNLADAGRGASNYLFGTEFDDSETTGWSNPEISDQKAGVSLAYRKNLQQDQDQVLKDISAGNYWDAVKSAGNVAFRTAADSAATLPELAAGAVLTPVAGVGLGVIGRRIQKASETAKNIAERYEKISSNKALELAGKAVKESSKASILTADIVQQQRNQFKSENNGENPSAQRLASMTLLTLATTIWQPQIASKLFIPKIGKTTKKDGDFRERFQKEVQSIVDTADKGIFNNLGKRVVEGVKGIAAAGGAEAVQEYAQFWAETLGTKMKPDEVTGFFESAANLFADEGIRDQAIQAAFLGGAAGGATKVAISTPGNLAGAAVDTTLSTADTVGRKIKERTIEAAPDASILSMTAEDESRKRAADKFVEKSIKSAESLSKASSISDVSDNSLTKLLVNAANGKDLNNTEVFNSVKSSVISDLKAKAASATIATTGKRVVGVGKRATAEVTERAAKLAEEVITPERVQEIKDVSENFKNKIITEFKSIPESTTLGLVRAAGKYSESKSKEGLKLLQKQARASGIKATRKLADVLDEKGKTPYVVKALKESALKQERAEKASGLRTDSLTTKDNLSTNIKSAVSIDNVNSDSIDQVMAEIYEVGKGEFDRKSTASTVIKAIDNVVKSKAFENIPSNQKQSFIDLKTDIESRTSSLFNKAYKKVSDTFELIPKSENSSVPKTILDNVNKAFVSLVNSTNKYSSDSGSKVVSKIPITSEIESMKLAIQSMQAKSEVTGDNSVLQQIADYFSNPDMIDILSERFDTKDPAVIQSLFNYFAPSLADPKFSSGIKENLESHFKSTSKPKTSVDGTVEINEDTDTSNLKNKKLLVQEDGESLTVTEIDNKDEAELNSLITICK